MNLICPNCQKVLSVADTEADQTTTCTNCQKPFMVPLLPASEPVEQLPIDIPLVPLQPAPASETTAAQLPVDEDGGVYKIAQEPARMAPPPPPLPAARPRREPRKESSSPAKSAPPPVQEPAAEAPPPPQVKTGYDRVWALCLSPRAVALATPVALTGLFLLMFFPWAGVYPGGQAVYTQNAFRTIWGGSSLDPVGEEVFKDNKPFEAISGNWLMLIYLLAVLAALIVAFLPTVIAQANVRLPAILQQVLPIRRQFMAGVLGLALAILLLQMFLGFGLEQAVAARSEAAVAKSRAEAKTDEQHKRVDIQKGLQMGSANLERTLWFRAALVCHLIALAATLLEVWLEKRGTKLMPRIEFHW